ncbi:MAG: AraC family transcriptional regulator [Eubacteriales bacterium]|nr:AraC family transcriptional regulator [Eubacteriales bacterium]
MSNNNKEKKNTNPEGASLRGYLNEDYRIFHIVSHETKEIGTHYHEFHKIIFLVSGKLDYIIEGNTYEITPGDILLVPSYSIHKPVFDPDVECERFVIWIRDTDDEYTKKPFSEVQNSKYFLVPSISYEYNSLISTISEFFECFEKIFSDEGALSEYYKKAEFVKLMVSITRILTGSGDKAVSSIGTPVTSDTIINEVINHINKNLADDLSAPTLAELFHFSTSRLEHRFRTAAGCSLHNYVRQKRLVNASRQIMNGVPIRQAAIQSGFSDYSSFYRAYVKMFGHMPSGQSSS